MAGDTDRVVLAELAGVASRYARQAALSAEIEDAVLAELRAIAAGRADLLAHQAGLAIGYGASQLDGGHYRRMAELLIKAGADESLVPGWAEVARKRADAAARDRHRQQGADRYPPAC